MCIITDAEPEGNKKDKSMCCEKGNEYRFYGVIIINNENFTGDNQVGQLRKRSWSQSDITKIKKLENHIKV